MKTTNSKFFQVLYPAFVLLVLAFSSCQEDEENLEPMRMFQPGGRITSTSDENSVTLSWDTPPNTVETQVSYTVEVAKDTLFQTPVLLTGVTDSTSIKFTDEQLNVRELYYARVKTNATENSGGESKWLTSFRFAIRGAQLFLNNPVNSGDITDRSVRLKFVSRAELTKIVIRPVGGALMEYMLSQNNLATGTLLVDNLVAGKDYIAEIFAGTRSRGTTIFRTKEPLAGILVDLRGFTNRPSVLQDTLTQIPNGSTVILKRGVTYTIAAEISLDKSVTITSGTDLSVSELATIYFTSNFNIASGSNIDQIIFRDVNLTGSDATAKYVFNINKASTIGSMTFDNVKASMFRSVLRLQSQPTTITNFTINNSVIDSIGGFAVVNVDVATSQTQNIVVRNSTIYKAEKVIVSKNNSNSVLFENVTVNEAPASGGYLVDYSTNGTNNVTNGVKIKNSILGIGKAGSQTIRGIRVSSTSSIEVSGTYATSDHVESANPLPTLTSYNGTSLALWQDPKNGNFRFKDASFAGKATAGDPRWR